MAKRQKFEVVEFQAGGFFVHGGTLRETYFRYKADADMVCEALNMMERLKLRAFQRRVNDALLALTDMESALKDGTEY